MPDITGFAVLAHALSEALVVLIRGPIDLLGVLAGMYEIHRAPSKNKIYP